ncbi:DUF1642 domain-containing protein [Lactiplantibacillus plantarum]|uniref:DUF1642 domain-containing protein n=1 Tax=Lactiplantibacillus plantarum TaxID=1590 RepID=UPI000FECE27F|nr:DUF1642 domain-containing protein [Lactiplantibacillus plantarum]QAR36908.1 hypothetical protein EQJ27_02640 [Lactiplantibacillus plantarum]RWZ07082.1 hypothetical protein EQG51_02640 [Lactiplantibacillus plantarum]RWZ34921.1 hypothetical protein EQG59_02640 [Lactiplantibacillus plantarum]
MIKVYRKTATIKAEQFDGTKQSADQLGLFKYRGGWYLETLEGSMLVSNGYWIATGVNGEHWAIADDVFKKTYAELPVIPRMWADTIEEFKANRYRLDEIFTEWDWNYDEQELIARAWLDGYVVEEDE